MKKDGKTQMDKNTNSRTLTKTALINQDIEKAIAKMLEEDKKKIAEVLEADKKRKIEVVENNRKHSEFIDGLMQEYEELKAIETFTEATKTEAYKMYISAYQQDKNKAENSLDRMINSLDFLTNVYIDNLAKICTFGTLKVLYSGGKSRYTKEGKLIVNNGSGNPLMQKLRFGFFKDIKTSDNLYSCINSASCLHFDKKGNLTTKIIDKKANEATNKLLNYDMSEAYDLYFVAYTYLFEKIKVQELTADTMLKKKLKNGEYKKRTVKQFACSKIREAIYAEKHLENNSKFTYIEELKTRKIKADNAEAEAETITEILDSEIVRSGKYYDVQNENGLKLFKTVLENLKLSSSQKTVLNYRLQGLSTTKISEKMKLEKNTVSTHLQRIQDKLLLLYPAISEHIKKDAKRFKTSEVINKTEIYVQNVFDAKYYATMDDYFKSLKISAKLSGEYSLNENLIKFYAETKYQEAKTAKQIKAFPAIIEKAKTADTKPKMLYWINTEAKPQTAYKFTIADNSKPIIRSEKEKAFKNYNLISEEFRYFNWLFNHRIFNGYSSELFTRDELRNAELKGYNSMIYRFLKDIAE